MTRHGMAIETPDSRTTVHYGPLVAKYMNERVEPLQHYHGNDKRMKARKALVNASLRKAVGK